MNIKYKMLVRHVAMVSLEVFKPQNMDSLEFFTKASQSTNRKVYLAIILYMNIKCFIMNITAEF
jgi:hypothetical protein